MSFLVFPSSPVRHPVPGDHPSVLSRPYTPALGVPTERTGADAQLSEQGAWEGALPGKSGSIPGKEGDYKNLVGNLAACHGNLHGTPMSTAPRLGLALWLEVQGMPWRSVGDSVVCRGRCRGRFCRGQCHGIPRHVAKKRQ